MQLVFIVLSCLLMGGFVFQQILRKTFFPLDPIIMFFAGCMVIYILQPIKYYDTLLAWNNGNQTLFLIVTFAVFISILFVIIGYSSRFAKAFCHNLPRVDYDFDRKRFFMMIIVGWILSLAGYWIIFQSAGGFSAWVSVSRGGTDYEKITAWEASLPALLPVVLTFGIFYARWFGGKFSRFFFTTIFILGYLWFFYLGSRSTTIFLLGTMTYAIIVTTESKRGNLFVLACFFVFLLWQTDFVGRNREFFYDLSFHKELWKEENNEIDITRGIEFNVMMTVFRLTPDPIPYNCGYPLLEFITRPIPRKIWQDKRYPLAEAFSDHCKYGYLTDYVLTDVAVPVYVGPAFSFVGYWFAMGGWLVLMLASFLTGVFFYLLRSFLEINHYSKPACLYYLLLFSNGYGQVIGTPLVFIFVLWVPFLGCYLLCKFVKKE